MSYLVPLRLANGVLLGLRLTFRSDLSNTNIALYKCLKRERVLGASILGKLIREKGYGGALLI